MAIAHGPLVWFDGEFVAWEKATVHVATHALHYGSSVFEGIRAYRTPQGTAIFRLQPHAERFVNSCKIARIALPYTADQVSDAIRETVARNGQPACYIRPLAFRDDAAIGLDGRRCGTKMIIFTVEWGAYLGQEAIENGVNAMVSSWRRMAPDTGSSLAKIGGQYVNSQFASMEARDSGFDEAIVLDTTGNLSEGPGENLFLIHEGIIYTPPLVSSILGGITRSAVITIARDLGYEVREQALPRDFLYIADEIFMTGTAAEVTPVRSVDRIVVGAGKRGPITQRIQERFFAIVHGEVPDTHGWLTPVAVRAPATGD